MYVNNTIIESGVKWRNFVSSLYTKLFLVDHEGNKATFLFFNNMCYHSLLYPLVFHCTTFRFLIA